MRLLGFLLIVVGLALAIGLPLYQSDFTGEEITQKRIYDRSVAGNTNVWTPLTLDLSEAQNPVRIRLEGSRAKGGSYAGTGYPVSVELTGPQGTVLSAGLDINLTSESAGGPPDEQRLYANLPDFDVIADGPHTLSVTPQLDRDISVLWMDAEFLANVQRPDNTWFRPGLVTAGIGAAMVFIGNRRRKAKKPGADKAPRWGRRRKG